jgi:hypothetical protein
LAQNYYAFEWGDALLVVLDAYRYYTASAKPRGWEWTLGEAQYNWLKETLENSTATFKFVFAHHVLGETRGGALVANGYEWGGYENGGKTWTFTANRPGWAMPIHQLMVENGVNIFFQGHDHLFAKEMVDGIVYQEVPMPSDSTYLIGTQDNGDAFTDVKIDASGHLRVTVSPSKTIVDYVRAWLPADEIGGHKNGEVAYSYTVSPKMTSEETESIAPSQFLLEQNYPNPFNPTTTISFSIPMADHVSLKIYNSQGQEIKTLIDGRLSAGRHACEWLMENAAGGVYFYRLITTHVSQTTKALYIK